MGVRSRERRGYHRTIVQSGQNPQRRASILEIIGAWLHIWTPPRDVRVPPVPRRKLAIWSAVGALVLGAALAVMIPRIQSGKNERAAADSALAAKRAAHNRARIIHAQTPHHADAANLLPAAGASSAAVASSREELLQSVQASIFDDARRRATAGEMRPVIGPTTCARAPGTPTAGDVGVFDCFVVTTKIKETEHNLPGALGYPFRAVVDYKTYAYTWCKAEQVPGEMLVLHPDDVTILPAECRGPKA